MATTNEYTEYFNYLNKILEDVRNNLFNFVGPNNSSNSYINTSTNNDIIDYDKYYWYIDLDGFYHLGTFHEDIEKETTFLQNVEKEGNTRLDSSGPAADTGCEFPEFKIQIIWLKEKV